MKLRLAYGGYALTCAVLAAALLAGASALLASWFGPLAGRLPALAVLAALVLWAAGRALRALRGRKAG